MLMNKVQNRNGILLIAMAFWIIFSLNECFSNDSDSIHREPNYCLRFDGKNDVVNAGDIKVFNDVQFITVEMWVRIDTFSAWKTFFCKFQDLNNRIQFQEYSEAGKIAVCVNNKANVKKEGNQAYYYTPQPEVTIGDWFHLAMVFDGTQDEKNRLKLYINGMNRSLERDKSAKGALPDHMPSTTVPLLLGAETVKGAYGYKGLMDEVRIWSVARTEDQIRSFMNSSLNGNEPGLQVYYRMSKNTKKEDNSDLLVDLSSAHNNAKLVNFDQSNCFISRDYVVPTVQSSAAAIEEPGIDTTRIAWKRGSGSSNAVFATDRDTTPPQLQPGVTYLPNKIFGKGSRVGESNWYCIYNGNDNSAQLSGLQPSTHYRLIVADYNGGPGQEQYSTKADTNNFISFTTKSHSKKSQAIKFDSLPVVSIDQKEILLKASASSNLPVTFTLSSPEIATVINDKLLIKSCGIATITASQNGNECYSPAEPVEYILTVVNAQPMQNTTPTEPEIVSKTSPNRFLSASWWRKNRNILIGSGGALALGSVIAILVSSKDHENEPTATMNDRPPSDPVLSN